MTLKKKLRLSAMEFFSFVMPMNGEGYTYGREIHERKTYDVDTTLTVLESRATACQHNGEEEVKDSQITCATAANPINMSLC